MFPIIFIKNCNKCKHFLALSLSLPDLFTCLKCNCTLSPHFYSLAWKTFSF